MSSSLLGLETFDWFLGISSPVGSCTEGTSLLSTHWNISNWTNFQKYWEIYTTVGTFINHTWITVLPIISIHSVHLGTFTSLACQVCPPLSHSVFTRGTPAWVRACNGIWILYNHQQSMYFLLVVCQGLNCDLCRSVLAWQSSPRNWKYKYPIVKHPKINCWIPINICFASVFICQTIQVLKGTSVMEAWKWPF